MTPLTQTRRTAPLAGDGEGNPSPRAVPDRSHDASEAVINAVAGLGVSLALVWALRLVGLWDASAPVVAAFFFAASVARSYALRRLFRMMEGRDAR